MVDGLITSAVDDLNLKQGTRQLVIDTYGLTAEQVGRVVNVVDVAFNRFDKVITIQR